MKKLLLILTATLFLSGFVFSATTLIDPSTNGGFESGSDFTTNGWTVVNGTTNMLYIGNAPVVYAGANCAFSGTGSTTWAGAGSANVNHFYRSVGFPAGETTITLKFRYKITGSDATYDYLKIWVTSSTPVAGTQLTSTQIGGTYDAATSWTEVILTIPSSYAGTTNNLVFSWRTDGTSPNAAIAIDNIELISKAPDPLHGVYSINNTLPTSNPMVHDGTGNFSSFSEAISFLNADGVSAAVTFNVIAGQTFNEKPSAVTATGTASNTITFQKSGAGANPKITPTGVLAISPYDFGFCISGGDYITFDGIDVDASAATTSTNAIEYGYLIRNASATNGAQYNTIKNCAVTLNKNYVVTTTSGCIFSSVNSSQGGVIPTNATGANSYNKYYNLTLQNAQNGVYLAGNTTYPDLSCEIGVSGSGCQSARNTITNIGGIYSFGSGYGIYTYGLNSVKIFNNDISAVAGNQASGIGIYFTTELGTGNEIYNNKIQNVSVTGSTSNTSAAYGLRADLSTTGTNNLKVYNNFISNVYTSYTSTATVSRLAFGMFIGVASATTSQSYDLDNNSVSIGQGLTPTYSNTCIELQNSSPVLRFRGNIFANYTNAQSGLAKHFGIVVTAASLGGTGTIFDYNDYYIANSQGTSGHVGRNQSATTNYNAIADWKTFTTGTLDENSVSVDPVFTNNNSDLHASAAGVNALSGFSTQAWVLTDIDCNDRSLTSPSDVGADAFNLASCSQPTVLTASNVTYTTADISWTAPSTGTPSGYEWEVRSSGLGGSGATGLVASGSTTHPAVSASVAGLSGGTSYTFYVRTFCGGSDYSTWASNSFTTLSCNLPTGVAVSAVTASSATLTWVAPVSGSPAGYEWEVRTSGAAGSGSTGLAASGSTTSPVVTTGVSGLSGATSYSAYVRTNCYTGFYSSWTSAVSFTTLCNPEAAPTVVQDFSTYTGSAPAPICWSEATGTLAASSTLVYGSSEWLNSASFANNGGTNKGVKVNLYSTGNDWIISQPIDLGATAGLYRLKYNMAVTSYNGTLVQTTLGTHKVDIVVSTDGGTTWSNTNVIKSYTGTGTYSNTGQLETINLTAYSGVVKIAVVETTTSSTPDIDFHFDDFVVEAIPSCNEPTGLTTSAITYNTANISWTAPAIGTPAGYVWEVRSSGAAGSGSTGLAASGTTTAPTVTASVSGLSVGSTYTLYVRTFCGGSEYSPWSSSNFTTLSCNIPTSVTASAITGVSATISWVAPAVGSPDGYEWEVRTSGVAGSGATGLVENGTTTTPVVSAGLTGLTPATVYYIYVRTNCISGSYSSWTSSVSFTTMCNPIVSLPWTESFESVVTPAFPICWYKENGDWVTAPNSGSTYDADAHSGIQFLRNAYTATNEYMWTPGFTLDAGTSYDFSFWWAGDNYAGWTGDVFYNTSQVSTGATQLGASFITSATTTTKTYDQVTRSFSPTVSGTYYFAIRINATSAPWYISLDDFRVDLSPSCIAPTGLTASAVTLTSATLSWTASVSLPSAGYEYEVRTSGIPGSGGAIASGSTGAGITTASVSGLSGNTTYGFYVKSNCGVGGYSPWTGPLTFFTGYCTPAPSSVDGTGITRVVFSTVNNPSGDETGHYGNYTALVGDAGQGMTIPVDITFSTGYTYDTKIWIDWNNDLDFSDSGEEVYSGTSLATNPTTLNASFIVPVSATLGNHRMRIGGVDTGPPTPCYSGSYGSFEDYTVNVILPPSCTPPTSLAAANISVSGADLSWSSPDSFFDIFIETFGAPAPGAGTTPTIDNNEGNGYTWKDGLPATTYQFYVRTDCGQDNTDVSTWAGPISFTTLCEVFEVPFTQNFDAVTIPAIPNCWSVQTGTVAWRTTDERGSYQPEAHSPNNAMSTFYSSTLAKNDWFFTPALNLSAGLTYKLSFWYITDGGTYGPEKMEVKYGTSPSSAGMTSGVIWNNANMVNGTYLQAVVYFTPTTSDVYYLGWHAYSAMDVDFIAVDDIALTLVPTSSTWSGAVSSDWTDAGNWNPDVPGPGTNVIIPGGLTNYPTLTAAASCNNFTIQSGGSFIGSEFLTVGGTTTIERSIDAYSSTTASDGWHLVSSPVASQAISGAWTPATGYDFYALDESVVEYWLNKKNHPEMTSFIPGKGYLVAYEVAGVKTFSGLLNSAAVTMSGLTNTPGSYAGSHLVGNPFTSAISAASLTGTNVAANVQVWNSANAAYEVAATIPALNGFMVYTTGSGELTIPLSARTHTGPAWFKSGSEDMILLQANDMERNMAQKSIVRFNTQATEAFDMEFDAYYLAGFAPMFYSKSADEGYALNTLPVLTNETVIPFDFIKNESSEFNIELVQAVPGAIIYLTDKKANKVVNLTETQLYQFTAVEGDVADRFLLTFGAVGIDNPDASRISIYGYRDLVYINGATAGSEVKITNLLGQEMIRTSVNGSELNTINAGNLASGVYVVSIISGNSLVSKKVVLEK